MKDKYTAYELIEFIKDNYKTSSDQYVDDEMKDLISSNNFNPKTFAEAISDNSGTLFMKDGSEIEFYVSEYSNSYDGGDISMILKTNEQYFEISGEYSSWDGNYWDDEIYEVVRRTQPIIRVFYEKA